MKISVVTVNYNNVKMLETTIQSVLSQTYKDFEYIVVDGASTDGSADVVKKYSSQMSHWLSEKDAGIYDAMNKGISLAAGEYCIFLNSGDTFSGTDTLKRTAEKLTADFICGSATLIYPGGGQLDWSPPAGVDSLFFQQRLSLCHQSLFIRTKMLKERPYDQRWRVVADFEQVLYEIVVNRRTYGSIDEKICNYGCDGLSSDHKKSNAEKNKILAEYRDKGHLPPDELLDLVQDFRVGTKKYRLALLLVRFVEKIENSRLKKWIKA